MKHEITEAALELFHELGYAATSVRMIARKARTTESVLYHYYDDKESVLVALLNEAQRLRGQTISAATAEVESEREARRILGVVAERIAATLNQERNRMLARVMFGSAHHAVRSGRVPPIDLAEQARGLFKILRRKLKGLMRDDIPDDLGALHFLAPIVVASMIRPAGATPLSRSWVEAHVDAFLSGHQA